MGNHINDTQTGFEGGSDGEAEPGEGSESDQELSGSDDGEGDEGEDALAALQQTLGGGDGAGAASALESDEVAALRKRRREEVARGKAVRQQRLLWERGLELRILLQRAAGAASRVPPAHASHSTTDGKRKKYWRVAHSRSSTVGSARSRELRVRSP